MGVLLIIVGLMLAVFGARIFRSPDSTKPIVFTGSIGGLTVLMIQLGGWGLIVYGLMRLFS